MGLIGHVEAEEAQAQAEVGEEPIVEPVAVAGSLAQIAAGLQSEEAQFEEPFRPLDAQASEAEDAAADDPSLASRSLADIAAAVKAMENNGEEHKAEDAPAEVVSEQPVEQITELPDEQAVAQQAPAPALVAAAPEPAPVEQQLSEQEATYVEMAQAMEGPNPVATDSDHQGNHDSDIEEAAFKGALMSPGADVAVSGSFERLKRSMMDDLDAKTESIMRPLLRDWLDENLPNMVERLVREEIERVSRG